MFLPPIIFSNPISFIMIYILKDIHIFINKYISYVFMRVYCDTCVYIDFYEWRPGKHWLHFGEEAKRLFDEIEDGNHQMVVSDHLSYQLRAYEDFPKFVRKMRQKGQLIEISKTKEDGQKRTLKIN